jgi:hypothetical protein
MKIKFQSNFGSRVQAVETTNSYIAKNILKHVGLDTPPKKHSGLLDQRSAL